MAETAKRFAGPSQLATTESTLYTVPASTTAVVRSIHVQSTSSSVVTFNLSIGADAAGTRFASAVSVPANGQYDWSGFLVLAAAETLRGLASAATSLTIIVSGVEVT